MTSLSLKIGDQRLMNPKVVVIGGTGRMGAWFSQILEPHCREIIPVGRSNPITSEQAAACDVLVFSVPMKDTVKVIRKIAPLASEDAMLMDLTSIKAKPMAAMLHYSRAEVVGAHPLFGPGKRSDSKKTCVLCEGRGEAGMAWIRKILESSGVNVLVSTPDVHDHMMGMIQGANHFASLAFAVCMARSGYSLDTLEGFSTSAFQMRVDRVKNMMAQPGELFGSLLMENPSALGFMGDYLEGAREILAMVKQGDTKEFGSMFEILKGYFGQDDEKGQ
jgi:prephenate dehydrogenase